MQACGPIHLKGAAYSHSTHTHRYSKLTLPSLCASLYCRVSKQHGEVIGRRLAASHAMLAEARAAAEAPAARMPPPLLKRHHTVSQKPQSHPSPVEAALERARWTKSLKRGKGHAPSATALASSGCSGQFVPGRSTLSAYRTSGTSPTTCSSTSARRSSSSRRAQGGRCAAPACACARMSLHACPHRHLALTRATWRRRAP